MVVKLIDTLERKTKSKYRQFAIWSAGQSLNVMEIKRETAMILEQGEWSGNEII